MVKKLATNRNMNLWNSNDMVKTCKFNVQNRKETVETKESGNEHIVKLIDMIETDNSYYMIMELYNGGDLYQMLKWRKTFNEIEARFLLR